MAKKSKKKPAPKPVLLFPRDVEMLLLFLAEIRAQLIVGSSSGTPEGMAKRLALHNLNAVTVSLRNER